MERNAIKQRFIEELSAEIASLPADFFSTFRYTKTGNNLTHPVTLGAIVRVVDRLPGVARVGIDVHLNDRRGAKFQPDVVGFDEHLHPLVVVDYESPNSSDARVPKKNWVSYINWRPSLGVEIPYFAVTTLPEHDSPAWQLRWAANGQCNQSFHGRRDEIRRNPFEFWYSYYRSLGEQYDLRGMYMVNISGGCARIVRLDSV